MKLELICLATFALLLFGCGRSHPLSIGMKSLDEARIAADKFMIEASPGLFLRSADTCKMSKEQLDAVTQFGAVGWPNATVRKHHQWTKMVDQDECDKLESERQKDWPDWKKGKRTIWNHQPEKYLIYSFRKKDGEKEEASVYFTLGLFRRDGLWHFAGQYKHE